MNFLIPHGWRTRLHILSRSHRHLGILCGAILIAGYAAATIIASTRDDGLSSHDETAALRHYFAKGLREVEASPKPHDRELANWLHDLCDEITKTAAEWELPIPTIADFIKTGQIFDVKVKEAIEHHAGPQDQRAMFNDYVIASLEPKSTLGKEARERIEGAARRIPPAPLANEFLGHLLDHVDLRMEALHAFRREGALPEAEYARDEALALAIALGELQTLRELLDQPTYRAAASGYQLISAGALLGDWRMQLKGTLKGLWERARWDVVMIGLLAASLWYSVFVRFGDRKPWRWITPLPALLAGVLSVGPTIMLVHYQDTIMGLTEHGGFPRDLIYYVAGVGLREELCKLALFAPFLPWLLRRRDPLQALLTGAFVGLGFALEENFGYYMRSGFDVATGRLLTANFFHAAMTGLIALAFYEMVRTRFAKAEPFIGTFVAVVLAHGIYDWAFTGGDSLPFVGDLSLISMLILALLAHQFFHQVELMARPSGSVISLLSIFVVGSAFIVAISLIMVAMETPSILAVNVMAANVVGYVPIVIFYLRRIGQL